MKLTYETLEATLDKAAIKAALPKSRFFKEKGQQYVCVHVGVICNSVTDVILLIDQKLIIDRFIVYKARSLSEFEQHILRPGDSVELDVEVEVMDF